MALAAGSTIAGNFSIFGGCQQCDYHSERRTKIKRDVTFWEFVRLGAVNHHQYFWSIGCFSLSCDRDNN